MVEQDIELGPEYGLSLEHPWPIASKKMKTWVLEKQELAINSTHHQLGEGSQENSEL